MPKSYLEFMNEITADELYKGLLAHGMFADKLPPIFSSEQFFDYCQTRKQGFNQKEHNYISFDTYRNTGVPRQMGIPNPMAYQRLCECLRENWDNLQAHFDAQTAGQVYKISRTHIRKMSNSDGLFEMNYGNWRTDADPEPDLLIGAHYIVVADISTCFPSIYTHSLPWAIVGKDKAKLDRNGNKWYNKIDKRSQNLKFGETHGLLIGPHSSNLLSEVILTCVDKKLYDKGWKFIRFIDDYKCYVSSPEEAQRFINELTTALRYYDLPLNYKKTGIKKLPIASTEEWVRELKTFDLISPYGQIGYKEVNAYFDTAIKLMNSNDGNAAILKYCVKVLAKNHKNINDYAKQYIVKTMMHLSILYPYLLNLMEEKVLDLFKVDQADIRKYTELLYAESVKIGNYEGICYAIFYAIKHDFTIAGIDVDGNIESGNCILKLLMYLYAAQNKMSETVEKLRNEALYLSKSDFDENWVFVYEVLKESELEDDWKSMKNAKVSFLKPKYQI